MGKKKKNLINNKSHIALEVTKKYYAWADSQELSYPKEL
jgi:hypothetical protein